MPSEDLDRLVSLVGAAREEALRLGPVAGQAATELEEVLAGLRAALARSGRPDEGVRPEDLTTANDR